MSHSIRRVEYFHTTVNDHPGEALSFLAALADLGANLVAFTAIPSGLHQTQLTVFPADPLRFLDQAGKAGLGLQGPYHALLMQGDDVPGALVEAHERLSEAGVNVYASTGVSGGGGTFGYVMHVRPTDFEQAAAALGI